MTETIVGQQIGHYNIIELVGSGGLGEVYKAQDDETGEIVAFKRLHERYQNNTSLLGLFHKEILIHAQVSHRHCVKFLRADLTPPNAHIVASFIDGWNLYALLKKLRPIPPMIACCIAMDLLQGLEHIHCMDIIHSDLTPSNVIVDKRGLVVLADFGLSCIDGVENYEGMVVGTPGYQAPERMHHAGLTALSDIYCAGIIFHELLSGMNPFIGLTDLDTLKKMRNIQFDWVTTTDSKLTEQLLVTLKNAMTFDASKRFQTPRDFMYSLYQCLQLGKIRYTRRAILQWLNENKMTAENPQEPLQDIYFGFAKV